MRGVVLVYCLSFKVDLARSFELPFHAAIGLELVAKEQCPNFRSSSVLEEKYDHLRRIRKISGQGDSDAQIS